MQKGRRSWTPNPLMLSSKSVFFLPAAGPPLLKSPVLLEPSSLNKPWSVDGLSGATASYIAEVSDLTSGYSRRRKLTSVSMCTHDFFNKLHFASFSNQIEITSGLYFSVLLTCTGLKDRDEQGNIRMSYYLHGLCKPEVQWRIHKGSPIIPILSRIKSFPRIDTYLFKVHSNIVLPSTPRPT